MIKSLRVLIAFIVMGFLVIAGPRALAQAQATELAALAVELWPDYDRPSMLVLLTGTLPATTALPATVTVPVPPNATLNAVARFTADNQLLSDVDYTVEGDRLTMTLPDARFRVEYYAPYNADGDQRTYAFNWVSDLPVGQLAAVVQQPAAATDITIEPEPVNVAASRGDGLQYHSLASRSVAAGEPFTINVAYTTPTGALSAPPTAELPVAAAEIIAPPSEAGGLFDSFSPWWLAGIFGVMALVGLAFYFGRRQGGTTAAGRPRKPQPNRPPRAANRQASNPKAATQAKPTGATPKFCHQCGEPLAAGDRFCRSCGTPVKAR